MARFNYRAATEPETTVHAIITEADRETIEDIAYRERRALGRVAGEMIKLGLQNRNKAEPTTADAAIQRTRQRRKK